MCFDTIRYVTIVRKKDPTVAYKVFVEEDDGYLFPFRSNGGSGPCVIGGTYFAIRGVISAASGEEYVSGFHAFEYLRDAQRYRWNLEGLFPQKYRVVRVNLWGKTTFGFHDRVCTVAAPRMELLNTERN